MKKKRIYKIALWVLGGVLALGAGLVGFKLLMVNTMMPSEEELEMNSDADSVVLNVEGMFSTRDLENTNYLSETEVLILSSNEVITIDEEGSYLLSGYYENTSIVIDVLDDEKVQLILDTLIIVNENDPVVYVKEADKVFVTLADTNSYMEVTSDFNDYQDDNVDAVVFSKSDITFNGTGTLEIKSTENAVSSKDDLKITAGTYFITSENHGLEANDSIRIYDCDISISSKNDGLHSENDDESLGYIYISGGTITINALDDAVRANSLIQIDGGVMNIEESSEGLEATKVLINNGEIYIYSTDDGINATAKTSYRVMVEINGGAIFVTMSDGDTDGIDSNGDFVMTGGEVNVTGGMAAFDIDGTIEFFGGDVYVDGEVQSEIITQSFGGKFNRNK